MEQFSDYFYIKAYKSQGRSFLEMKTWASVHPMVMVCENNSHWFRSLIGLVHLQLKNKLKKFLVGSLYVPISSTNKGILQHFLDENISKGFKDSNGVRSFYIGGS